MSTTAASELQWRTRGFKVRFKKQDEPGITARLLRAPRGAMLVEDGGNRVTRVREITFDGGEPRRTEGIGRRLVRVEPFGEEVAVLMEGAIRFFDPVSFAVSEAVAMDRFTKDLTVSPTARRCYVGFEGFILVVDRFQGATERLDGVSLPRMALCAAADGAEDSELWIHPAEGLIRLVRFCDDGRLEVVRADAAPELSNLDLFLASGSRIFALGKEKALDRFPFPGGPVERALERWSLESTGLERQAAKPRTRAIELLGTDAEGLLVALAAPGKIHVQLLDQMTLEPRGSRAFPKNGMYPLAALVGPSAVLAFRIWQKLDRVFFVSWGRDEIPAELRIADAKTAEEA